MNLHIAPNRLVSDIQKDFAAEFGFLKLEFFSRKTLSQSYYPANERVQGNRKIGDLQLKITDGDLEINGDTKVKDLEKRLKDEFGLAVQVFRKSGKLWLETTMSDHWSLAQQNTHGKELSEPVEKSAGTGDYDLERDNDH